MRRPMDKTRKQRAGIGRREALSSLARCTATGTLGLLAYCLLGRNRKRVAHGRQVCVEDGVCGGCSAYRDCAHRI